MKNIYAIVYVIQPFQVSDGFIFASATLEIIDGVLCIIYGAQEEIFGYGI